MSNTAKTIVTAAIVSILVMTLGISFGLVGENQAVPTPAPSNQDNLGGTGTRFPNGLAIGSGATVDTTGAFSVGNDGSQFSEMIAGSCNAVTGLASHSATTTKNYFCEGITGVTTSDHVFVQLPRGAGETATGPNGGGLVVTNARATTTDSIQFGILNLTGAATTSISQATTSVRYWIFR